MQITNLNKPKPMPLGAEPSGFRVYCKGNVSSFAKPAFEVPRILNGFYQIEIYTSKW